MMRIHRSPVAIVFFLLVMFSPKPSAGQYGQIDRAEWKRLENASESARHTGLSKILNEEQALLEEIAREDRDPGIRAAAAARVRSQEVLATLAVRDPEMPVRKAATVKLSDPQLLARIIVTDTAREVRAAAAANRNMTDQALLASVAQSDLDASVRVAAVRGLTNQPVLGKIARQDSDEFVREITVKKLTDQEVLGKVARQDSSLKVRLAAVGKLSDQSILAGFADDAESGVRTAAVSALTDQAALAKIARSHSDPRAREMAAAKLTDQAEIAAVATSDKSASVRKAAVKRLTIESVLAQVAGTDPDALPATAAAERLRDELLIQKVAKSAHHSQVRGIAVYKLKSQAVLAEIAQTDVDAEVRSRAVQALENPNVLALVAKKDPVAVIAEKALSKLRQPEPGVLKEIVSAGASFGGRMAALERIDDRPVLETFAKSGADPWIRGLALVGLAILGLENDQASELAFSRLTKVSGADAPPSAWTASVVVGGLNISLALQNLNKSVSFKNIKIESALTLQGKSGRGPRFVWHGGGAVKEVLPGQTLEAEYSGAVSEDLADLMPPGLYSVIDAKFVVTEAVVCVLVPHLPGEDSRHSDLRVLGNHHRFTLRYAKPDFDEMFDVFKRKQ